MTDQQESRCSICRGTKREHIDVEGNQITQHMFTTIEGDLMTPAEHAKRQSSQPPRVGISPNVLQYMGNAGVSIGRLVEVLLEKQVITPEEALYIAGMAPKPTAKSGYKDPAVVTKAVKG